MYLRTWKLTSSGTPNAKAENWEAELLMDSFTGDVLPCNVNPMVLLDKCSSSTYSPHPLNVYVLPSSVVMWGSPHAQAVHEMGRSKTDVYIK